MKKRTSLLFLSSIALIIAFALPAGAATAQKVRPQSDKAIATAPPTATRFILAAADTKAKPTAKAKVKVKKPATAKAKTKAKAEAKKSGPVEQLKAK